MSTYADVIKKTLPNNGNKDESNDTNSANTFNETTTTYDDEQDATKYTKLFVGGLSFHTTSKSLHDHFVQYGKIYEAVVIFDSSTGVSKGYGFVTFESSESAKKAIEIPNPSIDGRRTNVNLAYVGAVKRNNRRPVNFRHRGGHSNRGNRVHHHQQQQLHPQNMYMQPPQAYHYAPQQQQQQQPMYAYYPQQQPGYYMNPYIPYYQQQQQQQQYFGYNMPQQPIIAHPQALQQQYAPDGYNLYDGASSTDAESLSSLSPAMYAARTLQPPASPATEENDDK